MKQLMKAAVLTIVLMCARTGFAQDAKIAIVDVERLTLASDAGKTASEQLQKKFTEISALMQRSQKEIEDKETRLKTQDRVMSATAKAQLAKEIETDKLTFDRKNQDYQKQLSDMQDDLLGPISEKAQKALADYVKEKGFTVLFDLSAQNGNIVWFNKGNEITDDVIKRLNEEMKKATPAAATAAPRPPATPAAAPAGRN